MDFFRLNLSVAIQWRLDGGAYRAECKTPKMSLMMASHHGVCFWRMESGEKIHRLVEASGFKSISEAHKDLVERADRFRWGLPATLRRIPDGVD